MKIKKISVVLAISMALLVPFTGCDSGDSAGVGTAKKVENIEQQSPAENNAENRKINDVAEASNYVEALPGTVWAGVTTDSAACVLSFTSDDQVSLSDSDGNTYTGNWSIENNTFTITNGKDEVYTATWKYESGSNVIVLNGTTILSPESDYTTDQNSDALSKLSQAEEFVQKLSNSYWSYVGDDEVIVIGLDGDMGYVYDMQRTGDCPEVTYQGNWNFDYDNFCLYDTVDHNITYKTTWSLAEDGSINLDSKTFTEVPNKYQSEDKLIEYIVSFAKD